MKRAFTKLLLAGMALAALLPAQVASAHPLGNFSVNHYSRIEMSPAQARIFYVVDLAEIPTFQLKAALDRNDNQRFDDDEQQAFLASRVDEIRRHVTLFVDGEEAALQTRAPALTLAAGQGGLDTLRLSFWLDAALPAQSSPMQISFNDTNDLDRLGWREIVVKAGDGVRISNANVSDADVSNELRHYPQDLLNQPLRETSATFDVAIASGAGRVDARAGVAPSPINTAARDSQFASLINYRDLTPSLIAISLLTALGLGALHALEPGHGKSLAAAYLIGTRATPKHAVMLGLTVTVTHTASVFVMGLVTLFLSRFIVPEKLFPVLGLMSALIVIVMGASMIVNAVRQRRQLRIAADHTHTFDANTHQLVHEHGGKQHTHVPPAKLNARNVMAVGVSGGLVPCPAALIVLLSAIALGRVGFGMLLIVAFSIGLAGVLTAISLMLVYSKRALHGTRLAIKFAPMAGSRIVHVLPFASGAMIVCAGALLLVYALPFLQLL